MNNIFDNCCSAIFTDVCDRLNVEYNLILDLKCRFNAEKIYGKVRTMKLKEELNCDPNLDLGLDLIQDLKQNEILFVEGSDKFAYFGELLGLYCNQKSISGVIINGRTRDSFSFQNYNFSVYCKAYSPIDIVGRGKVDKIDCHIKVNKNGFSSGDFLFCDWEGCFIISQENLKIILPEVKQEIVKENKIKSLIAKGQDLKEISKKIKYI